MMCTSNVLIKPREKHPAQIFLERYLQIDREIDEKTMALQRAASQLQSVTQCMDKLNVVSSHPKDKLSDGVLALMEKKEKLDREIAMLVREQQRIQRVIDFVPDGRERSLLGYRYVSGLDLIGQCDKMGLEKSRIHVIHGRALQSVKKILQEWTKVEESGLFDML